MGIGNLLQDAYGYSKEAIFWPDKSLLGNDVPYEAKSGLIRSFQERSLLGTSGALARAMVLSLPGIAQIDAINRRDAYGFGASLPSSFMALDGMGTFGGSSELAATRSRFVFDDTGQLERNGSRVVFNQGNAPTCAPTSCGMILDTLGRSVDLVSLVESANVGANGLKADHVADLLRGEGVDASFKTRMTVQDLADATINGTPAIAAVRQGGGHAIVVDGVTTRKVCP